MNSRDMKANHNDFAGDLFENAFQDSVSETNDQIDLLFSEIDEYRKSTRFKEIMDFCVKFRHQSPFNAMLIELQFPGCRYALTSAQWRNLYGRKLKPNARPLIYLNHCPVGTLYDIGDTEPINPDWSMTDEAIIQAVTQPFKTEDVIPKEKFDHLVRVLPYHGIAFDENYQAAASNGAYIKRHSSNSQYAYQYNGKETSLNLPMFFLISVNKDFNVSEKYKSILHELGHFFCHHLESPQIPKRWWERRSLDKCIREFEAECTSYLLCKRLGIPCDNSISYIEGYIKEKEEIPLNVSVTNILKSVAAIERMLENTFHYKDGLLYQKEKPLAKVIDDHNSKL